MTGVLGVRGARSFLWAGLGFGGNRLLMFAMTLVLARLLAPADFGVVTAGLTLVLYFEIALDLGVGAAVVYEQEAGITRRVHTAFTINLIMSVLLTGTGVLCAPVIARFFGVATEPTLFRVLFLYLLIRGAGQVPDAILKRDLAFGRRTVVDLGRAGTRLVVSVALALAGYRAWAMIWGLLAGELSGTVICWYLVRYRPRLMLDRSAGRFLLSFGSTVLALKVVDAISLDSDYVVVGHKLGTTALGYYGIAYRLPELVLLSVYGVFSSVAFPLYARARAGGPEAFTAAMLQALRLLTMFSLPAGAGLALIARDAVPALFSAQWVPAVGPMTLLALAMAVASVGYASGDIFPAIGRPGLLLAINTPVTFVMILGFIVAAPHGIMTVAAVHLGANLIYEPVRILVANRLLGSSIRQNLTAMRPGAAALVGVLVAALPIRLLAQPGVGALCLILVAGTVGALVGLLLLARRDATDVYLSVREGLRS